jgi:hypothetical protein
MASVRSASRSEYARICGTPARHDVRHRHCSTQGMPDRRRDKRYRLMETPGGTMRIFLDVIVQRYGKDEWIAVGREGAHTGETLMLDVVLDEAEPTELRERIPVCVIDSRPVIVDGDMRHRIRLHGGDLTSVLLEQPTRHA